MKALVSLLLTCGALASAQASAHIDEPDIAADCQKVAGYAALGKSAYQRQDYAKAADIFRDQAAWSEFCGLSAQATATAYNNVALALMHAGELLKAQAYLGLAPQDSKSQHNLGPLRQRLAQRPQPAGPAGIYWQYAGRGVWSEVAVKPWAGVGRSTFPATSCRRWGCITARTWGISALRCRSSAAERSTAGANRPRRWSAMSP